MDPLGPSQFDAAHFAAMWGPGLLILIGLWLLFRRLIDRTFSAAGELVKVFREDFKEHVNAQVRQATAINEMVNIMKAREESDQNEHREILICLRVLQKQMEGIAGLLTKK